MAGMTYPEWRLTLINAIRRCYSEFRHAEERLAAANGSKDKDRISLWSDRRKNAGASLEEAFQSLPEVQVGMVDMDAVQFAKPLSQPPPVPVTGPGYMTGQLSFFETEA